MSHPRIKHCSPASRSVKLPPPAMAIIAQLRTAFRQKFGRAPGPGDPVFFDPDADEPRAMDERVVTDQIAGAMEKAGIDPAKIYAFKKTGLIPTEENVHSLRPIDLQEFANAVDEYRRKNPL